MERTENIYIDEETEEYVVECPFCHHISKFDWPEVTDPCEHLKYVHETVNYQLGNCDWEWYKKIRPIIIQNVDRGDMEYFIEDKIEIDDYEDEIDVEKYMDEYIDQFVKDGHVTVDSIIRWLEHSGQKEMLDSISVVELIEEDSGNGTYCLFDSAL